MIRIKFIRVLFMLFFGVIITRLFYWQVIQASSLAKYAFDQYYLTLDIASNRGEIRSSDGSTLVTNKRVYLVYAQPQDIEDKQSFSQQVSELMDLDKQLVLDRINQPNIVWSPLKHKITEDVYLKLQELDIKGIGFEPESQRFYPEASMAAHLLGFVGSDENGKDKGYFGLEGFYNLALSGREGSLVQEKDAQGLPILLGTGKRISAQDGQSLELYLDRAVQFILEDYLVRGIKKYGAKEGLIAVMDPVSGGILGAATYPKYAPDKFTEYEANLYPNPLVAQTYEPGSTFKAIVMASALNEKVVTKDTKFNESGPISIGGYTIRTWNNEYHGEITMTQVLERSSNPGMVFVGKQLGAKKLVEYIDKFGFGKSTGIDLEEEESADLRDRNDWKEIDLATASFGQGIAVTPIQMLTAFAALANEGKLMQPRVVKKIIDPNGHIIEQPVQVVEQVISPSTAKVITEMLISAVDKGEAKWAKPAGFRIAGKTGTAQIPVSGHYDQDKTIASFVGYTPADKPKFVMLVMLREPTSSPWGSETAAPLFFDVTKELLAYYGISPRG